MSKSPERIDHAAEAQGSLDAFGTIGYANDEGCQKQEYLAEAQVHATLALVEQQRIANVIALSESGRTTVNGARAALAGLYHGSAEEGSAYMALRPEIAAALGLDQS